MDTNTIPSTWQDALENHPVSNVRAFEKQLRASALRDKEKLRILVGNNYRDLLLTAEQIIELNDQSRRAEVSISTLSQACKPPIEPDGRRGPSRAVVAAAHIKLTDRLLRYASKATKERSVLLASRLIVIARLLLKDLEQEHGSSKTSQWLTTRLKTGRQQLLDHIDSMFTRPTTLLKDLVQAAGAYCLSTSSSSADVVRHFRALRAQRLAQEPATDDLDRSQLRKDLQQRCYYFIASVTAIKALSGRSVVELLNTLQKQPILENQDVLAIETLQLDTIRRLVSADILSFTPYFKRTTPSASELRATLQEWVNEVSKYLLKYITAAISNCPLRAVIKTRQVVLDILLPSCSSTLSNDIISHSIRETFSKQIIEIVETQAHELLLLGKDTSSIVQSSQPPKETIWQSELPRKMTAQPAPSCLRDIRRAHLGISNDLINYLDRLRTWLLKCQQIRQQIGNLSKTRWQDKIEEFDEDDEETAQEIVTALSKTDPAEYLAAFDKSANESVDTFITTISDLTSQISSSDTDTDTSDATSPARITTLLRIIRESINTITSLLPSKPLKPLHAATEALHTSLAKYTSTILVQTLDSVSKPSFVPDDVPSQAVILLLKTLCTLLSEIGAIDIWTVHATDVLKRIVLETVLKPDHKEKFVSSELDEAYLRLALKSTGVGGIATAGETKVAEVSSVDRRANSYWGRTKLLFGVLNP